MKPVSDALLKMENYFLDLKLKLRGKGLFDLFLARETKNDVLNESNKAMKSLCNLLVLHLLKCLKRSKKKTNVIFTNNELKQALGLSSEQNKTIKKPYVFSSPFGAI